MIVINLALSLSSTFLLLKYHYYYSISLLTAKSKAKQISPHNNITIQNMQELRGKKNHGQWIF